MIKFRVNTPCTFGPKHQYLRAGKVVAVNTENEAKLMPEIFTRLPATAGDSIDAVIDLSAAVVSDKGVKKPTGKKPVGKASVAVEDVGDENVPDFLQEAANG